MIDAKSYMKQLRVIDQRILRNTEEIEKLRVRITGRTAKYDTVGSSPGIYVDAMDDYVAAVDERIRTLAELNRMYTAKRKKIETMIFRLADANPYYTAILTARYIDGTDFWKISDNVGLTYDTTLVYHSRALRLVQVELDAEEMDGSGTGQR